MTMEFSIYGPDNHAFLDGSPTPWHVSSEPTGRGGATPLTLNFAVKLPAFQNPCSGTFSDVVTVTISG
jgi:spore coat protein U-like protein